MITRQKILNWPIGIINSIVLTFVFFGTQLYAQAGLQLIYTLQGIYGWIMWYKKDENLKPIVKVRNITSKEITKWAVIGSILTFFCTLYFQTTGDPAPFLDSLITVFSLIANYFICLKIFENWTIFLVLDVISIALFITQGIWITAGTYLIFMILCILGFKDWNKELKENEVAEDLKEEKIK